MKKHILILSSALLCISAFAQVPNYVPTNGLVAYWPFNGNANDESGNNNNGTVNGATLTTDRFGVANKSYSFNNSEITTNISSVEFSSNYSISIWVMANANNEPYPTFLMGNNVVSGWDDPNYLILQMYQDKFVHYMQIAPNNGGVVLFQSNTNTLNMWHHLVISNVNQQCKMYINGIENNMIGPIYLSNFGSYLHIGNGRGSGEIFIGKLDDIGIWNRGLTQCEIQDLYHAELNSAAGISAGPDQTVCEGEFITLNGSGGTNYVWNNSVVDGVPFIPTASMDYPVLGQDANGCIGTDTMHVELIPTSSSTLTETALDSYTLNGQTYTQSGTYTQVIPNAAGCDSTITLNLSLDFTGISELNKDFSIAPNPATNQITISTNNFSNEKYTLFDPQGRKVLEGSLTETTTQLDLSKLAKGNYLLQIGEKLTPVKLVKE